MASTINIQATMDWALPYVRFQPLTIGGQDPALTAANMTLQMILGPPFQWRWNRNTAQITCQEGVQDYEVAIVDYGFEEKASIGVDLSHQKEITWAKVLALDGASTQEIPANIAAQDDDGMGNITFRVMPVPDQDYTGIITYQKKPQPILSLAGLWYPIPDEYQYIYNWGFVTMAQMLTNDPRMAQSAQKFAGHLLGAQSGLTERQINIFLSTFLQRTGQVQVAGLTAQQGVTARTF